MSVVSGVISRKVLLACGNLCFLCPAMRARSRQPVKRMKNQMIGRLGNFVNMLHKILCVSQRYGLWVNTLMFLLSLIIKQVVSVVLENYACPLKNSEDLDVNKPAQEVLKVEGHVSSSPEVATVLSWKTIVNEKGEVNVSTEDAKNPSFWSRVCLHNMVLLAREATTRRRILESLFLYIDNGNLWSPENGLAFPVLRDMQLSGENSA